MQQPIPVNTHISSLLINVPFDFLWQQLSNPLNFPQLYPHWTSQVESKGNGEFEGVAPEGDLLTITPYISKEQGVIDFKIVAPTGNEELSRSRIFPLKTGGCMYIHLAVQWEGIDHEGWEAFKQGTDRDLENARVIIEQQYRIISQQSAI